MIGLWVYGPNTSISEASPFNAPALVSWKEPIESRVLGAKGMRADDFRQGSYRG